MRTCKGCNRELEEKSFVAKGGGKRGYICYRCKYERKSSGYKLRANQRKNGYTISEEEYESILSSQNGKCAMCGSSEKLCVDHDHTSGKVRGLLCSNCNVALGMLRDSPDILRAALNYLA